MTAFASEPDAYWSTCAQAIERQEQASGIPDSLLMSIARAESGRFREGSSAPNPWPWTVMAERRGRYLDSKADAVQEVEALQRRGVRNIDVGCMQINLHHHRKAFESLNDAFDPEKNAAYAAKFLMQLHRELGSWTRAVGFYHSRTSGLYQRYCRKVLGFWEESQDAAPPPPPEPEAETVQGVDAIAAAPELAPPELLRPPRRLTPQEALEQQARRVAMIQASADARRGLAEGIIERQRAMHAETVKRQRSLLEQYRDRMREASRQFRRIDN